MLEYWKLEWDFKKTTCEHEIVREMCVTHMHCVRLGGSEHLTLKANKHPMKAAIKATNTKM